MTCERLKEVNAKGGRISKVGTGRSRRRRHNVISRWDETDFAETLDKAPEFDGHVPADVLDHLKAL
jgi:hypothetical protein